MLKFVNDLRSAYGTSHSSTSATSCPVTTWIPDVICIINFILELNCVLSRKSQVRARKFLSCANVFA